MPHNIAPNRLIAAMALYCIEKVHFFVFLRPSNEAEWASYFLYAASFDLFIIFVAEFMLDGTLRKNVQFINLLAICINMCGFLLYFSYMPIFIYNLAINILYFLQYVLLLSKNGIDIKRINNFARRILFYFSDNNSDKQNNETEKR